MKDFLKMFFASSLALAVAALTCFVAVVVAIVIAGSNAQPLEYRNAMLVVDLSDPIVDKPPHSDAEEALRQAFEDDGEHAPMQLLSLVRAIHEAEDDQKIKGIVLLGQVPREGYASGLAALKELREALADFKDSGKRVIAYAMELDEATFFVDSVADEVILHPFGHVEFNGFASQGLFFAKALEKLGVGVQVTRVGKYKSAVEPFLLDKMSDANREQLETLVGDLWAHVQGTIAEARKLSPEAMKTFIDAGGIAVGEGAVSAKLVDKTSYFDELLIELKELTGAKSSERTFRQVKAQDYVDLHDDALHGGHGKKLAVVYAEGNIVDGDDKDEVGGDTVARLLRKARLDKSIGAVVLRVNSPGGSATASEVIGREVQLIKAVKPIVVSMGTVAASGGYWISAFANRIFAEPSTITGSIGVFGLLLNFGKLTENIGVTADTVKTEKFADIDTVFRPKSEGELGIIQHLVDGIYKAFIDRVTEGRNLERSQVEEIAQGRVWSGERAKTLGLVDELGGLEDALMYAATTANLGEDFSIVTLQKSRTPLEQILEMLGEQDHHNESNSSSFKSLLKRFAFELKKFESLNDPRGVYARLPIDITPR